VVRIGGSLGRIDTRSGNGYQTVRFSDSMAVPFGAVGPSRAPRDISTVRQPFPDARSPLMITQSD
jgi:hypothetical protein